MSRRLQTYSTDALTVTFDPTRCIHAAECVRQLPLVFDPSRPRWVRPELAAVEDVTRAIQRCPTGALQYRLTDGATEPTPTPTTIHPMHNGPLYVRGEVNLTTADGQPLSVSGRFALCRCGQTKNGPFCDGSHRAANFRT